MGLVRCTRGNRLNLELTILHLGLITNPLNFELHKSPRGVHSKEVVNRHLVGGEGSGLIRANHRSAAQSFNSREGTDNGLLLGHTLGSKSQTGGNDSGETLGDSGDSQRDGDLEVIDRTTNPPTKGRVVEVANVDQPHDDTQNTNGDREVVSELVQSLLQGEGGFLLFGELFVDLSFLGVETGSNNDTNPLPADDIGPREKGVDLVLSQGVGLIDSVGVLSNILSLTGQDRLIAINNRGAESD
mmetsp:Transcript_10863/g.16387  ORF Transcript_10863/g.16387 Transcript_10863/m.16387 type:complete len:243 (+) Transcript_10863:1841-2569(+)